jgi:hypothetical protein
LGSNVIADALVASAILNRNQGDHTMDEETRALLNSLDTRLASIEMILKVIANSVQKPGAPYTVTYPIQVTQTGPDGEPVTRLHFPNNLPNPPRS